MKKFAVIVTPQAQADIAEAFAYIHQRSPLNAARWIEGLYAAIDTLETLPERCALAREDAFLGGGLRQLLYKSHRLIFSLDTPRRRLHVLHFRHAKRQAAWEPPTPSD